MFILEYATIIVIAILFLTLIFSKRIHRFVSGILLLLIGMLPTLIDEIGLPIDVADFPVLRFAAFFLLLYASKDIFVEGFKQERLIMKAIYLVFAIFLISITTIPTLYSMDVIEFTLPYVIENYYNAIYIATGVSLIIGTFIFD